MSKLDIQNPFTGNVGRIVIPAMNILLAITGAAAVASFIFEYGFAVNPPISPTYLHIAQGWIVAIFVCDRIARVFLSKNSLDYLKSNWIDFALIFFAILAAVIAGGLKNKMLRAASLYLIITQVYLLISLIIRGLSLNLRFADSGIHPTRLLVTSFAAMCLAGAGLLMLPSAVNPRFYGDWYFIDALFTATSATCVTGLVVKNTGAFFTTFGQAVILVLIQLGGLGIMLFGTVMAMMVGKDLSTRTTTTLGQMISIEKTGSIARTAKFVLVCTVIFEAIGAVTLYPMFRESYHEITGLKLNTAQAVWHSVFHSVSAFCNAGFALFGDNFYAGVNSGWETPLRSHFQILGVIAPLIIIGGLGFPVLQDIGKFFTHTLQRRWVDRNPSAVVTSRLPHRQRLSLHSKMAITATIILLLGGTAFFWAVESAMSNIAPVVGKHNIDSDDISRQNQWAQMSIPKKLRESFFLSVTARTAGFNTIDISALSDGSKLLLCGLMSVGGSPAGTAGGMKTITFTILLMTGFSMLRRSSEVEVFNRSLRPDVVYRAVMVAFLYLSLLAAVTVGLSITMRGHAFLDLLFEACSACGTVGLSTGITHHLTDVSQAIIIVGMFAGRLGPVTILVAITRTMRKAEYSYPPENVIIG